MVYSDTNCLLIRPLKVYQIEQTRVFPSRNVYLFLNKEKKKVRVPYKKCLANSFLSREFLMRSNFVYWSERQLI